jgi:stage II sporulation protein D
LQYFWGDERLTFNRNCIIKLSACFLWIAIIVIGTAAWANEAVNSAPGNSASGQQETLIRVGLARNLTAAVTRVDAGTYVLTDGATGLPIAGLKQGDTISFSRLAGSVQVTINGAPQPTTFKGPMLMRAADKSVLNLFSYQNVRYRDDLTLLVEDSLTVINALDVEKYLYGVVGPEIGVLGAPMEALKAQAVVSRSYALNMVRPGNKWDVGIDTLTQVYRGYNAETVINGDRIIQAVNDTKGLVIYYQFDENKVNRPIEAYFHANAGGHTENSENVWLNPLPYIKGTPSPYDKYALEYHQDQSGWPANSYVWQVSLSREQAVNRINQWNTNNSSNGQAMMIGNLEDIKATRWQRDLPVETISGRVTQIELIGSARTASVFRDRIRTLFGLKSTLFTLKLDSELAMVNGSGIITTATKGLDLLSIGGSSNLQQLNGSNDRYYVIGANSQTNIIPKQFENITFAGKGHGHGLGMSQWGAIGMANAGYNFADIIQHYYNQGKNDNNIVIAAYRSY